MAKDIFLRGRMARATRVTGCGDPLLGPDSRIVTRGFVSVTLTPNNEAGTAITLTRADGSVAVDSTPTPKFKNFTAAIALSEADPEFYHLLTGDPLVLDADGQPVGFDKGTDIDVEVVAFALELWLGAHVDVCDESGATPYGYGVLPFFKGGTIGSLTVENGLLNITVEGATTRDGNAWGVGPYDVVLDEDGNPSPLLTPLGNKKHLRLIRTEVAPPAESNGLVALGVPATGAVAATGATTPANSYAPLNLAELVAGDSGEHGVDVVASPATAWTSGQSLTLRDGTRAHWDGDSWEAGPA